MWAGPYSPVPQPCPTLQSVQGFRRAGWTVRGVPDEGIHVMVGDSDKERVEGLIRQHYFLDMCGVTPPLHPGLWWRLHARLCHQARIKCFVTDARLVLLDRTSSHIPEGYKSCEQALCSVFSHKSDDDKWALAQPIRLCGALHGWSANSVHTGLHNASAPCLSGTTT